MIKPLWKNIWDKQQQALVNHLDRQIRELSHDAKLLPNLATGDQCHVKTGKIVKQIHQEGRRAYPSVIPPPINSHPTLVPEATSDEMQNQTPLTDTSCQSDSPNTLPPINRDHSESDRQNVVDQPSPLKTVEPTTSRPKRMRNPPTLHHDYEMNSISNS